MWIFYRLSQEKNNFYAMKKHTRFQVISTEGDMVIALIKSIKGFKGIKSTPNRYEVELLFCALLKEHAY